MRIVINMISAVFAVLSLIAALSQLKSKEVSHMIMACGAVLLIAAVAVNLLGGGYDWVVGLLGAALICAAAIWNGKRSGNFHLQHHVIRIVLSIFIVVGFILF